MTSPWNKLLDKIGDQSTSPPADTIEAQWPQALSHQLYPGGSKKGAQSSQQTPLVSIIVTLYDCALYIEDAVGSLLRQTHPDLEIILVDDCSRDGSSEIAARLAREHASIILLKTRRNLGTYVAKNLGLLHVNGRYVTFQDADDLSHPRRVETQLEAISAHGDCVASTCKYARIDQATGTIVLNRGEQARSGLITLMIDWPRVKDQVGFFDCARVNADDEYKSRIKRVFGLDSIIELPDCHYYAAHRSQSLTNRGHTANNLSAKEVGNFLAPVRQRYTKAFQDWHVNTELHALKMEFPPLSRGFRLPRSINPFLTATFSGIALVIAASERQQIKAQVQACPYRLMFSQLFLHAAAAEQVSSEQKDIAGIPLHLLRDISAPDTLLKTIGDLMEGSCTLMLNDASALEQISADEIRIARYLMLSHHPRPSAIVHAQSRSLFCALETLDSSTLEIEQNSNLISGALLGVVAANGLVEFQ